SSATSSPTALHQRVTVPSVTVSPSCGMVMNIDAPGWRLVECTCAARYRRAMDCRAGGVPARLFARRHQPELDEDRDSLAFERLLVDLAGLAALAELAVSRHEGLLVDRGRVRLGRGAVFAPLPLERGTLLTLQLTRTLLAALS